MSEKYLKAVTDWLICEEAIETSDRELYEYAIRSFAFSISPLLIAIFEGIILGCLKQSIVLIIPFMMIRKFSGGYHSKHLWSCLLSSCSLLLLCLMLSKFMKCGQVLSVVTIFAVIGLIFFSPVDNENRKLDYKEKSRYQFITIITVVSFGLISIVLYQFGQDTYAVCVAIGIILTSVLQLPCILQKIKLNISGR